MKICMICGSNEIIEDHHIIKRSQSGPMINCKLNLVSLCYNHHRGTIGVHGPKGRKLDQHLKLILQRELQEIFKDGYYTLDEIKGKLNIPLNGVIPLCKTLKNYKGKYKAEDIIRQAMGGKLVLEGD